MASNKKKVERSIHPDRDCAGCSKRTSSKKKARADRSDSGRSKSVQSVDTNLPGTECAGRVCGSDWKPSRSSSAVSQPEDSQATSSGTSTPKEDKP